MAWRSKTKETLARGGDSTRCFGEEHVNNQEDGFGSCHLHTGSHMSFTMTAPRVTRGSGLQLDFYRKY